MTERTNRLRRDQDEIEDVVSRIAEFEEIILKANSDLINYLLDTYEKAAEACFDYPENEANRERHRQLRLFISKRMENMS